MDKQGMGALEIIAIAIVGGAILTPVLGLAGDLGRQALAKMVDLGLLTEHPVVAIPQTAVGLDGPRLLILAALFLAAVTLRSARARRRQDDPESRR